jgi:probable rRNA maturation factor
MTPQIDLSVSCVAWRTDLPDLDQLVLDTVTAALDAVPMAWADRTLEVHLDFLDDHRQQQLNRDFRGQDRCTNVLAFANMEGDEILDVATLPPAMPIVLGDVTLAHGWVRAEAQNQQKPLNFHVRHLIVHGVLHLLGYDHIADSEANDMEAREVAILAGLGVPDPYLLKT